MSMKVRPVILWVGVLVVLASFCASGKVGENINGREYVLDLRRASYPDSDESVNALVDSYHRTVGDLIRQLGWWDDKELSAEQKTYGIYVLGALRAVRAVPILMKHIDLKAPRVDPKFRIGRWALYPATEALTRIGKPAVRQVLRKLPMEKDITRRRLMSNVITDVEGEEAGRLLIEAQIASHAGEEVQDHE